MGSDDLIVLDNRNKDISPQVVSRLVIDCYHILKKKSAKGNRAYHQFTMVLNALNNEEVFGVACCCMCKMYKKGVWRGKVFGYEKR